MQYRHLQHAGNFADVFKHGLLVWQLRRLLALHPQLDFLESHAGAGAYRLPADAGADGIARLMTAAAVPAALADYLDLVRTRQRGAGRLRYPGSPCLAASLLRAQDSLQAAELNMATAHALRRRLALRPRSRVIHGDGYAFLRACMPTLAGAGLVLIDPPYLHDDESVLAARAFMELLPLRPAITGMLWYPLRTDMRLGIPERWPGGGLRVELVVRSGSAGMPGCGMCITRSGADAEHGLRPMLEALVQVLAQDDGASWRLTSW